MVPYRIVPMYFYTPLQSTLLPYTGKTCYAGSLFKNAFLIYSVSGYSLAPQLRLLLTAMQVPICTARLRRAAPYEGAVHRPTIAAVDPRDRDKPLSTPHVRQNRRHWNWFYSSTTTPRVSWARVVISFHQSSMCHAPQHCGILWREAALAAASSRQTPEPRTSQGPRHSCLAFVSRRAATMVTPRSPERTTLSRQEGTKPSFTGMRGRGALR